MPFDPTSTRGSGYGSMPPDRQNRYNAGTSASASSHEPRERFTLIPTELLQGLDPDDKLDKYKFPRGQTLEQDIGNNPFYDVSSNVGRSSVQTASDTFGHLNYVCREAGSTATDLRNAAERAACTSKWGSGPLIRSQLSLGARSEAMHAMLGPEPTIGIGMTEEGKAAVFTNRDSRDLTNFDRVSLNSIATGSFYGRDPEQMSERVTGVVQHRSTTRPEPGGHSYVELSGDEVTQLQRGKTNVKEMKPLSYCSASVAQLYG